MARRRVPVASTTFRFTVQHLECGLSFGFSGFRLRVCDFGCGALRQGAWSLDCRRNLEFWFGVNSS